MDVDARRRWSIILAVVTTLDALLYYHELAVVVRQPVVSPTWRLVAGALLMAGGAIASLYLWSTTKRE